MTTTALEATEALAASNAFHPRVTLESLEASIAHRLFFTGEDALRAADEAHVSGLDGELANLSVLTVCLLVMRNGFTIIGKSAPASAENFDAEKGRTFAYEDAIRQLWPLEGYVLRTMLRSAEIARETYEALR